MTQLFALASTRLWSGGLWLGAALLLAGAVALLAARKSRAAWPPLTLAVVALLLVLASVLALYVEGDSDGGRFVLLIVLGLTVATVPVLLLTQKPWLLGPLFLLLGVGALWMPVAAPKNEWTYWLLAGVGLVLATQLFLLFLLGVWWSPVAYAAAGVAMLVLGGWLSEPLGTGFSHFIGMLDPDRVTVAEPWWLALLLLIPWLIWTSYRSLAGLGPVRAATAIALRAALVLFLTLALANVQLRRVDETITVIFLWDRSQSVPQEIEDGKDQRADRLLKFINQAVEKRGAHRERDQSGLILFGRWPRLELPPAKVPAFRLSKDRLKTISVDGSRTDIAGALKLALASFPGSTGKRIVLLSDGNENIGRAEEQALIFKNNHVQIDVVPLAVGQQNTNEVLIERVDPPTDTEQGTRRPLYVTLRSYHPETVVGQLQVFKTSVEKEIDKQTGQEQHVLRTRPLFYDRKAKEERPKILKLKPGATEQALPEVIGEKDESCTYEAVFTPLYVENVAGKRIAQGLPGDRPENNRASTSVVARGKSRVLLIENKLGEHKLLVDRLRASNPDRELRVMDVDRLPQNAADLLVVLADVDCVILANIPAEKLTDQQQEVLRSNTHDQGCGMVVIGGRQGFGAGGWQNTKLEKAWPVQSDLKSLKVEGKSGLVLVMHASEIADGNMWQKKIAKLAVEKLSAADMVGMAYFDFNGGHKWHIPFKLVGPNRPEILRLVETMSPGDMPDAEPSLRMAYDALTDPKHGLGTKHIIFISDGDHWQPPVQLLQKIKQAKITCTTVCITSHGQGEVDKMKEVAARTGGRAYHVTNPKDLPAIYIKETRLVSQAFIHDKPFFPELVLRGGPTANLPAKLPELHGFVRTSKRDSPLVEVPIISPKAKKDGLQFPILAYWQYGLGTTVAFTSDGRGVPTGKETPWDLEWANSGMYTQFWDQVIKWAIRREEQGGLLRAVPEVRDNRTFIVVYARDDKKEPQIDLKVTAHVTGTGLKDNDKRGLEFRQRKPGEYEAELRAEDVGAYFLNIRATRRVADKGKDGKVVDKEVPVGSLRTVVTVPYSPEFGELRSNPDLLENLRRITDGRVYEDSDEALEKAVKGLGIFRPAPVGSLSLQSIWYWLLVLVGVGLFCDVAVRRIALEPEKWSAALRAYWERLAGRPTVAPAVVVEKLQTRTDKLAGSERRYEATPGLSVSDVPSATGEPRAPGKAGPRPGGASPGVAPEAAQEPGDFASRLMRAKKRALEDRDKKDKP